MSVVVDDRMRRQRAALEARTARGGASTRTRVNTRVFNCYRMTLDARKAAREFRPLFRTEALNHCIISKEVVPSHLRDVMRPHQLATKIHFPYSEESLYGRDQTVGGRSVYVGETRYSEILWAQFLEGRDVDDAAQDLGVFQMLDELPSLDPFLIRDKFAIAGTPIDEAYLQIPLAEWKAIRVSIIDRFRPLARIAFQDNRISAGELERATLVLVEKMWEAIDLDALRPLTMALRVDTQDAGALYYAWKGIVYYDFKVGTLLKEIDQLRDALDRLARTRQARLRVGETMTNWQVPRVRIDRFADDLSAVMKRYHRAYDDFFLHGGNPSEFRRFFAIAEDLFYFLGSSIAVLDSCVEQYRAYRRRDETSAPALIDLWQDLMELTHLDDA